MSLDVFKSVIQGYANHIFDLQLVGVQTGYWAGYYSRAKKPKSVKSVIQTMTRSKSKNDRQVDEKSKGKVRAPDVDVESFLAMEEKFNAKRRQTQAQTKT